MNTISFYQDIAGDFQTVTNKWGFTRKTIVRPERLPLTWRIKASLAVLKGEALVVHWQVNAIKNN